MRCYVFVRGLREGRGKHLEGGQLVDMNPSLEDCDEAVAVEADGEDGGGKGEVRDGAVGGGVEDAELPRGESRGIAIAHHREEGRAEEHFDDTA